MTFKNVVQFKTHVIYVDNKYFIHSKIKDMHLKVLEDDAFGILDYKTEHLLIWYK